MLINNEGLHVATQQTILFFRRKKLNKCTNVHTFQRAWIFTTYVTRMRFQYNVLLCVRDIMCQTIITLIDQYFTHCTRLLITFVIFKNYTQLYNAIKKYSKHFFPCQPRNKKTSRVDDWL